MFVLLPTPRDQRFDVIHDISRCVFFVVGLSHGTPAHDVIQLWSEGNLAICVHHTLQNIWKQILKKIYVIARLVSLVAKLASYLASKLASLVAKLATLVWKLAGHVLISNQLEAKQSYTAVLYVIHVQFYIEYHTSR